LHDFISHQNIAGKNLLVVSSIAKEIALCLKFLNETCGVCHGDVKVSKKNGFKIFIIYHQNIGLIINIFSLSMVK
jgi:hypothetical protein